MIALIVVLSVYRIEKKQLENDFQEDTHYIQETYKNSIRYHNEKLASVLTLFQHDHQMIDLWSKKERQRLLSHTLPVYQKLEKEHDITHLYFHDPAGVNFLRVHQPKRHSDLIDRYSMKSAKDSGNRSSGVELGPLGTFTLRVVDPVVIKGKLLGYLEFGQEIDHLIFDLKEVTDKQLYVFVYKKYLEEKNWQEGVRLLGHKSKWNQYPDFVLVSSTMAHIPDVVYNEMLMRKVIYINACHCMMLARESLVNLLFWRI